MEWTAKEERFDMSTWESPRGQLLTNIESVDAEILRLMYDAESSGADMSALYDRANAKTRRAWSLGYLKPVQL